MLTERAMPGSAYKSAQETRPEAKVIPIAPIINANRPTAELSGNDEKVSPYQLGAADIPKAMIPSGYVKGRITGPVKAFRRVIDDWNLDIAAAAAMLGFEPEDGSLVAGVLDGVYSLRGRDTKDRIAYAIAIHHALRSLYRNVDIERQWLTEPKHELHSQAPISFLKNGAMDKLLAVKQLVEFVAGR